MIESRAKEGQKEADGLWNKGGSGGGGGGGPVGPRGGPMRVVSRRRRGHHLLRLPDTGKANQMVFPQHVKRKDPRPGFFPIGTFIVGPQSPFDRLLYEGLGDGPIKGKEAKRRGGGLALFRTAAWLASKQKKGGADLCLGGTRCFGFIFRPSRKLGSRC